MFKIGFCVVDLWIDCGGLVWFFCWKVKGVWNLCDDSIVVVELGWMFVLLIGDVNVVVVGLDSGGVDIVVRDVGWWIGCVWLLCFLVLVSEFECCICEKFFFVWIFLWCFELFSFFWLCLMFVIGIW